MDLIGKIKDVLKRANKKSYEVLIGKLNEPKLRNLAIVDMYVIVGCRETSLIDSKEFMVSVITPHELFMALIPTVFPWECKIITDFRVLLKRFEESQDTLAEKEEQDLEEYKLSPEEQTDQLQLVKVEHRDLVPIFSTQVLQKFDQMAFKGLDLEK